MLIITNVSPSEAVKLNEEKAWLEGLDVGDYFEIGEHPETFFLVDYTDREKAEWFSITLTLRLPTLIRKRKT